MLTKTIKLEKGEYTNFEHSFFDAHDVIMLTGARGRGKSFPCAKYISAILERHEEKKFAYMRMRNIELATYNGWCGDLNLQRIANDAYRTKLSRGDPTAGDILLRGYDEEDMQIFERVIGKCMSLESAADYKSGKYDEFSAIVFEEYARYGMNPENEKTYVRNFLETVQTVFRNRPMKIFLLANNLKSIPLLETAIEELTGEIFVNPVKVKIFGKSPANKTSNFMAYLNGELYDDDDFIVIPDEFDGLFSNKEYIIKKHRVYPNKYYVMQNKTNEKVFYREQEFLRLQRFCVQSSNNEFYYQNSGVEKRFILGYRNILTEISLLLSTHGARYIS